MANDLTNYLKTAFEYKNKGDNKEAIDYFYKALALDNDSTEIMYELAMLYSKLCQYERAYSFFEQIISKNPDNFNAKQEYALLLEYNKEYKKALEIFNELYINGFDIEKTAQELFYLLYINKEYEKITDLYNSAQFDLNKSAILYYTAMAYSNLNQEEKAREFYKKSFEVDENNVDTGAKIGEMLLEQGKIEEAQQLALRLLKCAEDDKVFYLLAEVHYIKGDIDSAIKYYSYAISINPQSALYYFKLGIVYSLKGFFEEALKSYTRASSIEPENQTYNYALAYFYYMNKNYSSAEEIIDSILDINKDNKDALALKIILLILQNKVSQAEKLVDTVYSDTDKTEFMYYALSVYYSKLNAWENAIIAVKHAIDMNNTSIEYKYQLAKFYFNLLQDEKAEQILQKIIKENPKYINSYILSAQIYLRNKNYDEVLKNTENGLALDKNIPELYYLTAEAMSAKCNWEKASENYKIAASMDSSNSIYYAKIGYCCYKNENYQDAYYYYKEAANLDMINPENRYYMAKCSENLEDWENASANYSLMRRLAPYNADYNIDYAEFLNRRGSKKNAIALLKTVLKTSINQEEKQKIKTCLDIIKKKS